ncbi:hypothetical protein [Pseudomonas nitroreducens]|uniref:hypothetical protein n=1 Tax=Pseudomonas nitroreducens TaxID=46680 RepID=UPI001FB7D9BA|nr:hypothetical protein [Pseudomonas nitroreducens]MCJ1882316.1 hypothetical protein [Pseudomonas nitroreducens]MCJ1893397.1 hypothetical protein [Pseudomonas nitroreducens]
MKVELSIEIGEDVIDIPTMHKLPRDQYGEYVRSSLFWVDHHDVLRATQGEYPIATSAAQVEELIDYLKEVAQQMKAASY